MVLGLLLMASAVTIAETRKCDILVGELVPNAQIARDLAATIIRSRQTPEQRSRYVLRVNQEDGAAWVVFQSPVDSPPDSSGNIKVTSGGGGLTMRIDRCNGAMSQVYHQR